MHDFLRRLSFLSFGLQLTHKHTVWRTKTISCGPNNTEIQYQIDLTGDSPLWLANTRVPSLLTTTPEVGDSGSIICPTASRNKNKGSFRSTQNHRTNARISSKDCFCCYFITISTFVSHLTNNFEMYSIHILHVFLHYVILRLNGFIFIVESFLIVIFFFLWEAFQGRIPRKKLQLPSIKWKNQLLLHHHVIMAVQQLLVNKNLCITLWTVQSTVSMKGIPHYLHILENQSKTSCDQSQLHNSWGIDSFNC